MPNHKPNLDDATPLSPGQTGLKWSVIAPMVCLLGAIAVTWPLAWHVSSAIPLGTEPEATVPIFNLWTLWWTADRIGQGFSSYWNAPIFYPNPGTFSYSEPQTFVGFLVSPLWWLDIPPALIYNVALLLILTLNGLFAFRILRALSQPAFTAILGSLLVVALPFVAKVLGVLPVLPLFGLLWALDGLVRFSHTRHVRHAWWASAGYIVQCLTSQQLALLSAPFVGIAGLLTLWAVRSERRAVIHVMVALLGAVTLLAVLMVPILSLHRNLNFERPFALVLALSAKPSDFVTRPATALLSIPPRESPDRDSGGLFPGLLVLILAGFGFASSLQQGAQRRWTILLGAMVIGSFLLALGLHLEIGNWHPFWTLRNVVPGFDQLRSPFRFAILTQLGLCLLAAIALSRLAEWRPGASGKLLALTVGILAFAENLAVPVPLIHIPATPRTEWTAWLKTKPAATIVAHIPFPAGQHVSQYEIETWRLFAQIDHKKPIVNGYSGFFPPGYLRFQLDMARDFPNQVLLCMMAQNLRVNTVVIDQSWLAGHNEQIQRFDRFLQLSYRDEAVAIFRLDLPDRECSSTSPGPATPKGSS
ncbi:MAG: hypothetical protein Q7U76_14395 [Nitrospirota bacterium]|nr:hypothetical protein [Nitrospirota bacterium]